MKIKNLFKRLVDDWCCVPPAALPPPIMLPSPPSIEHIPSNSVESLPVSCLVRGIIKSIETEWDRWHCILGYSDRLSGISRSYHTHVDTSIQIEMSNDEPVGTECGEFNAHESMLIKKAIANSRDDRLTRLAREYEQQRLKKIKHFEQLGCPTTNTTQT